MIWQMGNKQEPPGETSHVGASLCGNTFNAMRAPASRRFTHFHSHAQLTTPEAQFPCDCLKIHFPSFNKDGTAFLGLFYYYLFIFKSTAAQMSCPACRVWSSAAPFPLISPVSRGPKEIQWTAETKKRFNSKSPPTSLSTELPSPVGRLTDHGWALSWCLEGPQETVASPLSKIRQRLILTVTPLLNLFPVPPCGNVTSLIIYLNVQRLGFSFFLFLFVWTTHRASPQTSSVWGNDSFQGLGGSHPCFLNCSRQRPYRSPGQHKIKELRCWGKTCYWAPSARRAGS